MRSVRVIIDGSQWVATGRRVSAASQFLCSIGAFFILHLQVHTMLRLLIETLKSSGGKAQGSRSLCVGSAILVRFS